ncbi:MAG: PAS domain-containing protein [Bacteroidota bacterium]
MKTKNIILEKNLELLLADTLVKNQELEQHLESLTGKYQDLEKRCNDQNKRLVNLNDRTHEEAKKYKDVSAELLRAKKSLDVKLLEGKSLSGALSPARKELNELKRKNGNGSGELVQRLQKEKEHLQADKQDLSRQLSSYQEKMEHQHQLFRAANIISWTYNDATNTLEFSENIKELLKDDRMSLVWDLNLISARIHPDDLERFNEIFCKIKGKKARNEEEYVRFLGGHMKYYEVRFCSLSDVYSEEAVIYGCLITKQNSESNDKQLQDEILEHLSTIEEKDLKIKELRAELEQAKPTEEDQHQLTNLQKEIERLRFEMGQKDKQLVETRDDKLLAEEILIEKESELKSIKEQFNEYGSLDQEELESMKAELERYKAEYTNLSLIASKTDNAIIITNKAGKIEYVNEGFEKLTEYTSEEVIGKKPGEFLQGANTDPEHAKNIRTGLNSGKPFRQDILNYSKTGKEYWLSISISPIFDEKGEIEKYIAVETDVTEKRRSEAELEEAESELRNLMENQFVQSEQLIEKEKQLSEALAESERTREEIENLSMVASKTDNAVIITDAKGHILYVNDGFERITEYKKEEVLGKVPGSFLQGPGTNIDHVRAIREGLNSKRPFKQEILNYSKSGKAYWLNISINPIFDEHGEVEKFIAIENEITAQKKREAEFENLSLVASKTDNAVIITDRDGLIEWVNPGFERITEYSLEEVIGKKPGTFLQGPETSKEDVRQISQGIKSQKPFKHQVYNYSKSGRGYWLSLSITPVFNENNVLERFIAIESDITQEKEAEEQSKYLSLVASRTDNAVIITDKHGMIEWVNDGFVRLTEYTLNEVKGKKPGSFLQGEKTSQEDVMAIRRGINRQKPFKQQVYNYSKSGKGYWLSLSITPIFDEYGEVDKYIAIESDITQQKEAEMELENLSLVASKTDNAVIVTDQNGSIEWVNQGFVKITEYTLSEVKGKKPGSFLQGPETREEDVIAIRKGIKSQKPFTSEIYNYSKSGNGYWLSLSITPIFDEYGMLDKFIAIERDITEERKLAAEIEESENQMRIIMDEQFANQEKLIQQEQTLKDTLEESKILSLVASKTDNAVIVSSKEGLIQYVNDGFEKITGYTLEEVRGKKPGSFLQGPDTSPEDVAAIREGLKTKKPFTQEILNYSKNGKPYWLSLSITPILDQDGEIEQFIAIESDISERKASEEELENLSLVASKTENAVIISSKDGLIEWVNEGFEKITEYTFDEVIGKKPGAFLQGEETTPEQVQAIRDGLATLKPFTSEIYNYSKSGKGYWLSLSITPIFDEHGEHQKFIAIESDITERKMLELEMQESEEQMRTLMDQQFSSSETLMKKEEELNQALEEEKERKKELDQALGRLKETQSQIVQSEKMASLGQLTAGIAHEINNPINFVYNGIDSLNMSIEDLTTIMQKYNELEHASGEEIAGILEEIGGMKKRLRYEKLMNNLPTVLSDIKNGANRTIEIVKGLRVFSRLDEEDQKPANINECLDSTLILLRNKTKDKIKVQKFFDESLGDVMCYPGQLNQVFMNLLSNAVQAMPEEKKDGKIMIYTENLEKSLIVRIMDNGSGIPEEVKKRIFEPFFTTKPVGIGTGLGLSISYGIIEKHDGKIYVNSEVDKGTEFVIELPKERKKTVKTVES